MSNRFKNNSPVKMLKPCQQILTDQFLKCPRSFLNYARKILEMSLNKIYKNFSIIYNTIRILNNCQKGSVKN